MILSIVIPTYTKDVRLLNMTLRAISSIRTRNQPDFELIISEDGGMFSEELAFLSTAYIYNTKNKGFTVNVNRGWRQATGNYVAIMSSDTYLVSGNLLNLCIKGKVTSPMIENQDIKGLAGCFFVVPKEIAQERGMLNEAMHTYYSDEEYKERTKDIFLKIPSVVIHHDQAQTVNAAGVNNPEQYERDRIAYETIIKNK